MTLRKIIDELKGWVALVVIVVLASLVGIAYHHFSHQKVSPYLSTQCDKNAPDYNATAAARYCEP